MQTAPGDKLSTAPRKRRSGRKITLLVLTLCLVLSLRLFSIAVRRENLKLDLLIAIHSNDTPKALSLLKAGADPNAKDMGDKAPSTADNFAEVLYNAFHPRKKHEPVRYPSALLVVVTKQGPKFNGFPEDPTLVEALIEHGAAVNYQDKDGLTPLLNAVSMDCHRNARCLLEHGADPNLKGNSGDTPLFYADKESAELLLQHRADINVADAGGVTPLMALCFEHMDDSVQLLLQHGANVSVQDAKGHTPLLWACRKCRLDTIKMLLQHGAKVNVKDTNGYTPILYASRENSLDAVKMLLEHGADLTATTLHGSNALLNAASAGRNDLVQFYIGRGLKVNSKSDSGATPLLVAAQNGKMETVKLLLRLGADVNARNSNGDTPLSLAKRLTAQEITASSKTALVQMLQEAGAKEVPALPAPTQSAVPSSPGGGR